MPSLELAQSAILAVDAMCFAVWAKRQAGPVAFYGLLFALGPAVGLACQAAGWLELVQPGKWMSVVVTGLITLPFTWVTFRGHPLGDAAIRIERDRQARLAALWEGERVIRAAECAQARERAEFHRGQCYGAAALVEASL